MDGTGKSRNILAAKQLNEPHRSYGGSIISFDCHPKFTVTPALYSVASESDMSLSEARYAHCDGYTEGVRFNDKFIVTCGADGELRIWDSDVLLEESPINVTLGSQCNSVTVRGHSLLCATDGFRVQEICALRPDGSLRSEAELEAKTIRNFNAEILHLACEGNIFVATLVNGSAVICKSDQQEDDIRLEGHTAAVLSAALDPKKSLVATASGDGSVRIWSVDDGKCVKKLDDLFTPIETVEAVQDVSRFHRLAFLKDSNLIVAAERSLKLFEADSFSLKKDFEIDEIIDDEEYVFTMWTDGFSRVALATNQGLLSTYSLADFEQTWLHKTEETITSIVQHPVSENTLVLLSDKGELQLVSGIPSKKQTTDEAPDDVGAEEAFNPDEEILAGTGVNRKRKTPASDDEDDAIDLGAIKSSYMPTILGEGLEEDGRKETVVVRETVKTVHVKAFHQKPFQVGEVLDQAEGAGEDDVEEEDDVTQERRFLTYNHVGFVVCSVSAEESSIDVDFHNASDRHPLTLQNKGYTMAALDGHALALASDQEMMVYLLDPQAGEAPSWEVEIKHDTICGLTVGPNFIAMATINQFLRLFSPGGIQREVLALPGPLICLAGASRFSLRTEEVQPRENLLVFCHQGTGLDDRQNIICTRYRVTGSGVTVRPGELSVGMPRKVRMVWAGFTEEYRPAYMNSKGFLFIFNERQGSWCPVFDSRQSLGCSSGCFVVSVGERYNRLLYIACKKWSPRVKPLPVMVREKLRIPLLNASSDKSQLESRYLRLRNAQDESLETGMAKLSLQMFALAIKADRLSRASDIILMEARNRATLELLSEYAEASNRHGRLDGILRTIKKYMETGAPDEEAAFEENSQDTAMEFVEDSEPEPLKSQDLMPSAPILAPKRVALAPLPTSAVLEKNGTSDFNPFKKASAAPTKTRGGQLDEILSRKISKPVLASEPSPKLVPKQAKLAVSRSKVPVPDAKEKRSPIQIFMDEISDELKEESPDGDAGTWLKMAADRFRKLTPEQRENYVQLSKNPANPANPAKRQKVSS